MKKHHWLLFSGILILTTLASGCSGKSDTATQSIEDIQAQKGIPVRVREIKPTTFTSVLSYTSTLSGAVESTASAMIADEVETVKVKVGDYVQKDQVILTFPADNAALNYEQARVNLESARTAFQRISKLYTEDGVSQQSYDNARTQYEIAKANWDTVRNMKDVKAPISGYVTRLNVLESDNVDPGDPLFTISDYERLKSTVWITDREIGRIKVGQKAEAKWRDQTLSGTVIQVDMAMDQTRKAFAVKLEFDNSGHPVPSGVTADISIQVYSNNRAVVLDMSEVIESGTARYVYLADNGVSRRQEIEIGKQEGLKVEVLKGLKPGDALITEGLNMVNDGSKIRIIAANDSLAQR